MKAIDNEWKVYLNHLTANLFNLNFHQNEVNDIKIFEENEYNRDRRLKSKGLRTYIPMRIIRFVLSCLW